jgi:hypothetical protein
MPRMAATAVTAIKLGRSLGDAMTWHVQYRKDTVEHIARHPGPEQATHCRLLPSLLAQKASQTYLKFPD